MKLIYKVFRFIYYLSIAAIIIFTSTVILSGVTGDATALKISILLIALACLLAWEFRDIDLMKGLDYFLRNF